MNKDQIIDALRAENAQLRKQMADLSAVIMEMDRQRLAEQAERAERAKQRAERRQRAAGPTVE